VTVLPATDLFLMGRDRDHAVRRGVADANFLIEHGVNCSISSNNILNPFTPFGDCSLLRIANLQANVTQIGGRERIAACFDMLTTRSARLLRLEDYGIAVGNPGDLVVLEADSPEQAVAEIREPLAVFKRGRRTVTRHPVELHRPA
jgi:cytosine deaminase